VIEHVHGIVGHISLAHDAEIVYLEPSIATRGVGRGALGGLQVAVGLESEGERAVVHVSVYRHVAEHPVGGLVVIFGVAQHLIGELRGIILVGVPIECGVLVAENSLRGESRAIAVGTRHECGRDGIGAVFQSGDGL